MAELDIGLKIVDNAGYTKSIAVQEYDSDNDYPTLVFRQEETGDSYTIITCDFEDSCAIAGTRFALRNSHCYATYGIYTYSGLKALKEYGNDLYGYCPLGHAPHGTVVEALVTKYDEVYSQGENPYFYLRLHFAFDEAMVDGDYVDLYISEHFEGPFSLFDTYSYNDLLSGYIEIGPPDYWPLSFGKKYYFKARIIKAGAVGYFSNYAVGMIPDYTETPSFSGLEVNGFEGGPCIHFLWNGDDMNWGWSGLTPDYSGGPFDGLYEFKAGFEIQYTDVNPAVVPNIWEQEDTGDIVNPYEGHVHNDAIGWVFNCYDVNAESDGYKIWFRIRGVGYPYWEYPYDEEYTYGEWSDPAVGWVQGHEDDAGWQPDYPLRITNFDATTDVANEIQFTWDPVTDWPPGASSSDSYYIIYYLDDDDWTYLDSIAWDASSYETSEFDSGVSVQFRLQAISYNSSTSEDVYGEVSETVTGSEA